jgi:hypothetical protein
MPMHVSVDFPDKSIPLEKRKVWFLLQKLKATLAFATSLSSFMFEFYIAHCLLKGNTKESAIFSVADSSAGQFSITGFKSLF